MKFIYIDVETTGLTCPESGLIQLAGAIEVDGEVVEEFNFRVRPFPSDVVSEEALAVNGVNREDLPGHDDPERAFSQFLHLLGRHVNPFSRADKFHLVAYNADFDAEHLRAWFLKNGDRFFGSWFWHPPLDVMTMAAAALMHRRAELANFRLPTVARVLGFEVDESRTHDALYDAMLTRKLFCLLRDHVVPPGPASVSAAQGARAPDPASPLRGHGPGRARPSAAGHLALWPGGRFPPKAS